MEPGSHEAGSEGSVVTSPNGTQAVDRAAQLLLEVVHGPDPVTFTELTALTGLAKSTTSRLLMALERNGLVRRDSSGRVAARRGVLSSPRPGGGGGGPGRGGPP